MPKDYASGVPNPKGLNQKKDRERRGTPGTRSCRKFERPKKKYAGLVGSAENVSIFQF